MRRFTIALLAFAACRVSERPKPPDAVPPEEGARVQDTDVWVGKTWVALRKHTRISKPGHATHPSVAPDGRLFVYASTETSTKPQIFRRASEGVSPTQLTSNLGHNFFPRVSPDGKRVAFASDLAGNFDIYVVRLDAPAVWMQVTTSPQDDVAPSWSPDGRRIVYSSKSTSGVWQLIVVDVGTGIPTFLGPGMHPDWSPAGDWIAFQSQPRADLRSAIWLVRTDGTDLHEIVADRHKEWAAITPRFSPDGKWIVYATIKRSRESRDYGEAGKADDIWIVQPDGQNDTRLTDDLSAEWWPSWGGDRVFFVSDRDGYPNIYSVVPKPME